MQLIPLLVGAHVVVLLGCLGFLRREQVENQLRGLFQKCAEKSFWALLLAACKAALALVFGLLTLIVFLSLAASVEPSQQGGVLLLIVYGLVQGTCVLLSLGLAVLNCLTWFLVFTLILAADRFGRRLEQWAERIRPGIVDRLREARRLR